MKDLWHSFTNWVDHNRWHFLGIVVFLILSFTLLSGCLESKTVSMKDPAKEVTRPVFIAEASAIKDKFKLERIGLDSMMADFNARVVIADAATVRGIEELDLEDLRKAEVFDLAGGIVTGAASGELSPAQIVGSLITAAGFLLGVTKTADAKRKDGVITALKTTALRTPA